MRTTTLKVSLFAFAIVIIGATDASANNLRQKWKLWWHNVSVGHHRNNAWPEPFVEADAMQVVAPFEIMKRNGWRLHNTIGHELFRSADGALTASGQQAVNWIVTRAPASRRQIHVLNGRTTEETQQRMAAVQEALTKYGDLGTTVNVFATNVPSPTSNGARAMQISRDALENQPVPTLPSTSAAGTASAVQQ